MLNAFSGALLGLCSRHDSAADETEAALGVGDDAGRATLHDQPLGGPGPGDLGPESIQDDFWREGEDDEEWHSAGWKWFKQVRFGRKALYGAPNLLDLQGACVRKRVSYL